MLFGTGCKPDNHRSRKSLVTACVIVLLTCIVNIIFLVVARYGVYLMGEGDKANRAFRTLTIRNLVEFLAFVYFNGLLSRFAKMKLRKDVQHMLLERATTIRQNMDPDGLIND